MNKNINLDGFHDVMVEAICNRKFTDKEVQDCFNSLPDDIKNLAYEWGSYDTVFRDKAYALIEKQLSIIKEEFKADLKKDFLYFVAMTFKNSELKK